MYGESVPADSLGRYRHAFTGARPTPVGAPGASLLQSVDESLDAELVVFEIRVEDA